MALGTKFFAVKSALLRRIAGVFLLSVLALPANPRLPAPPVAVMHSRVNVIHNSDGSLQLGLNNTPLSYNWSGYSLARFATGQLYTSASASWTVPEVSFVRTATDCQPVSGWGFSRRTTCFDSNIHYEYSSAWVGIGGDCLDARCNAVDPTLIQLGTGHDVGDDGTSYYYAWYELLPASATFIDPTLYPVDPGDSISASLVCLSNCTPGAIQSWRLSMANTTKNWTFTITVPYASSLYSADWIVEAPSSSAGILPLANFGKVTMNPFTTFPNAGFGGTGIHAVAMVNEYGQTSMPSSATSLGLFSACWGSNMVRFAPCAAP